MDEVTIFEAAHVLGCPLATARELLEERGLAIGSGLTARLDDLEELAVTQYKWKAHIDDPDSYWVTVSQAAEILDLSTQRVKQLLGQDRLPHVEHHSGVRLMRRAQVEILANARVARVLGSEHSHS